MQIGRLLLQVFLPSLVAILPPYDSALLCHTTATHWRGIKLPSASSNTNEPKYCLWCVCEWLVSQRLTGQQMSTQNTQLFSVFLSQTWKAVRIWTCALWTTGQMLFCCATSEHSYRLLESLVSSLFMAVCLKEGSQSSCLSSTSVLLRNCLYCYHCFSVPLMLLRHGVRKISDNKGQQLSRLSL